ncbi:MAG: hypothetical protein HKN82_08420 [Akkermansiaceae bacterium]|nr:hypothetical protein [Akkermansiaceae bacterium]
MAVPRAALVSVSAGSGLVYVPGADERWEVRGVRVGLVDETAAEILEGIGQGEEVLVEGHWMLENGDRIEVRRRHRATL